MHLQGQQQQQQPEQEQQQQIISVKEINNLYK